MSAPVLAEMLEKMRVRRLRVSFFCWVPLDAEKSGDQNDLTFLSSKKCGFH